MGSSNSQPGLGSQEAPGKQTFLLPILEAEEKITKIRVPAPPTPHPTSHLNPGAVCILPVSLKTEQGNMEVGVSACWIQLYSGTMAFLWDQQIVPALVLTSSTIQLSELL